MKNIIFLGAPGSGKGTQASLISEKFGYPLISIGDLLRESVKNQTEIGKKAQAIMKSGELVCDDIVLNLVKERISAKDCDNGFILDGLPRNKQQAIELDRILQAINKSINLIFNIDVCDEVLIKRISGRFSCAKCGEIYNEFFKRPKKEGICDKCLSIKFNKREDDNENSVKNRLEIFHKNLDSIINHYHDTGKINSINGENNISKINQDIISLI